MGRQLIGEQPHIEQDAGRAQYREHQCRIGVGRAAEPLAEQEEDQAQQCAGQSRRARESSASAMWFKGQQLGTGQAPIKRYNRALRDMIAMGKAEPSFLVSHELNLDEAPSAYEHFDARDDGWTKVVLHPGGQT